MYVVSLGGERRGWADWEEVGVEGTVELGWEGRGGKGMVGIVCDI